MKFMKKNLLFILAACAAITASAAPKRLASVLEVEDGNVPSNPIDEMMMRERFLYNQEGQLYRVVEGNKTATITYDAADRSKMTLDVEDTGYGISEKYDITLDDAGNAVKAVCTANYGTETYTFSYTDGRLSGVRIDDTEHGVTDTETIAITYTDGNITRINYTYSDDPTDNETAEYTYSGVANTGNLRLLNSLYGIDMDNLEYVAQAGHMGLAPAGLPTGIKFIDSDGVQSGNVTWTLDSDGYPTRLNAAGNNRDYIVFTWESDPAGIAEVAPEKSGADAFYTLQGVRVERPSQGIFIVRHADGSCEKIRF